VNYYNEYDKKTAAWLRELIRQGLLPNGIVDERSIVDIKPSDLTGYTQCHFFAGIGGWSLALQLAGWPSDRPVWTGSCPCQPFSTAGKGLAQADERHLWPVFFNLIKECKPDTVFGEQVASAIGKGWLDGISADLETEGYACGATVLGAHSVGAPHIRQRLYWVANSNEHGWPHGEHGEEGRWTTTVAECSGVDGLGDAGCQCNERRGEFGIVGFSSSEEQSEAQEWQRSWNADSDSVQNDSAGFWSDFALVQCRDGKARRIPTEPLLQRVANGIPLAVDHLRVIIRELETQIDRYAKKTNRTAIEIVREMQHAFWSEAIQWDAGGRIGLLSPEILLAALCQLERELGRVINSSPQGIVEAQRRVLLRVREHSAEEADARPSPRREHAQQLARELADSLHELPHESALEAAQSIFDRSLGFPLTSRCPSRTTLLRGYGNAIVPQVAQAFIKAFIDIS
jgi:DNA (cytosine-5)-methyltransferase 1